MSKPFKLNSAFRPSGDQPEAIRRLEEGLEDGLAHQTLLGVTGSGKTFTIANVIADLQRPTMVLAPNKTLAAQLYGEMKEFFPENAVEYFVSYYDYYQPEAYVPSSDTFIEKDASVNEHIEQMRLSATKALLERRDVVVVASVSAIYGLGDPDLYLKMMLHLTQGMIIDQRAILRRLAELQYTRNDQAFQRGTFRVRGEVIDIFPAESDDMALRVELFDEEVERLSLFDPLTGHVESVIQRFTIYPKTHYVTPRERIVQAMEEIKIELADRRKVLLANNKLLEEQRLSQRTQFDLEMMNELGYCSGIENYSRYLSGRGPGEAEGPYRAVTESGSTRPATPMPRTEAVWRRSSSIWRNRPSTLSKDSIGRIRDTKVTAMRSPYKFRSERPKTCASTVRSSPLNCGLVPTEMAAGRNSADWVPGTARTTQPA